MKLFKKHDPTLIFSVYRDGGSIHDIHNHEQAKHSLLNKEIPFKEVRGRYNGSEERSFVVSADHYDTVRGIALAHQQSVMLYLDEYRKAYLVDVVVNEQRTASIGQWQSTGNVDKHEDYTTDPKSNITYVVR